jgi:endonuclease/exonuclease/phosphatase family metal-dependent hydrolase
VLSRFPITKQGYHRFSYGVGKDSEAKRGVLFAKIRLQDDCFVNIFNVHTQSNDQHKPPSFQQHVNEVRRTAIRELAYFIEETLLVERQEGRSDELNLLVGDFNIHRDPMNEAMVKCLFVQDKDWVDHLMSLDQEYEAMLNTLSLDGVISVQNLWDE